MRKKWTTAAFAGLLFLTCLNVAYGARAISLVIKGENVQPESPPIMKGGRIYVPLRIVSEYLNEDVEWNPDTNTVTVHPDVWKQDLSANDISRTAWVYARNTVIRFLMAYDEMDPEGKRLVSEDFQTNLIGPEVVIPIPGVGSDEARIVDFQFVDAKVDQRSQTMTIRVKLWCWPYNQEERIEKTWDFTLDLTRHSDEYHTLPLITKVWQVQETAIDSHTVFPGLKFIDQ